MINISSNSYLQFIQCGLFIDDVKYVLRQLLQQLKLHSWRGHTISERVKDVKESQQIEQVIVKYFFGGQVLFQFSFQFFIIHFHSFLFTTTRYAQIPTKIGVV